MTKTLLPAGVARRLVVPESAKLNHLNPALTEANEAWLKQWLRSVRECLEQSKLADFGQGSLLVRSLVMAILGRGSLLITTRNGDESVVIRYGAHIKRQAVLHGQVSWPLNGAIFNPQSGYRDTGYCYYLVGGLGLLTANFQDRLTTVLMAMTGRKPRGYPFLFVGVNSTRDQLAGLREIVSDNDLTIDRHQELEDQLHQLHQHQRLLESFMFGLEVDVTESELMVALKDGIERVCGQISLDDIQRAQTLFVRIRRARLSRDLNQLVGHIVDQVETKWPGRVNSRITRRVLKTVMVAHSLVEDIEVDPWSTAYSVLYRRAWPLVGTRGSDRQRFQQWLQDCQADYQPRRAEIGA